MSDNDITTTGGSTGASAIQGNTGKGTSIFSMKGLSKDEQSMLKSMYFREITLFSVYAGAVKGVADGVIYSLIPAFKRFYKDPDDFKDAMERHTTFMVINNTAAPLMLGMVAAMEKENSESDDFDTSSIDSVKASLMGPLSGIGDSLFWGVVRIVATGIGMGLAVTGSPLGPVLFLVTYNVPVFLSRWYLNIAGYKLGAQFFTEAYKSGLMGIVTKCAGILGLLMVGAMAAANVTFKLALSFPVDNADPIMIQSYLDSIFVGLVPISLTLLCLYLLRRNVNIIWIILGIMVASLLLGITGIC
jgi:PTS system mannose-specific IID component